MNKLDKAVAIAMGLEVYIDNKGWEWVKKSPAHEVWASGWCHMYNIADELMDQHKIETEYFGRRWSATCEGVSAQHQDRKTAALMAFCKFKGVAWD